MEEQKLNKNIFVLSSIALLFFLLFSISVSAVVSTTSRSIQTMPDLCLDKNLAQHRISLNDYFYIYSGEDITIDYVDPDNDRSFSGECDGWTDHDCGLSPGFATLEHESCFNMFYHFVYNPSTGFDDDILDIQTLSDTCYFPLTVNFHDTPGLDTTFYINISDDCGFVPEYDLNDTDLLNSNLTIQQLTSTGAYGFASVDDLKVCQQVVFNKSYLFNTEWWIGAFNFSGDLTILVENVSTNENVYRSNTVHDNTGGDLISALYGFEVNLSNLPFLDDQYLVCLLLESDEGYNSAVYTSANISNPYPDGDRCYDYGNDGSYTCVSGSDLKFRFTANQYYDPNSPLLIRSMPDLNLDFDSTYWIDLTQYFDSSTVNKFYANITSPYHGSSWIFSDSYGFGLGNGDFIDYKIWSNFTLQIITYSRPYLDKLDISGCGVDEDFCTWDTFNINVGSGSVFNSEVEQLKPMPYLINLAYDNDSFAIFPMNSFFKNYNNAYLVYLESNFSGIINDSFDWYYEITNDEDFPFRVYVNCSPGVSLNEFNIVGDLNITLKCGNYDAWYKLTPHGNYNNTLRFIVTNNDSLLDDEVIVYSGDARFNPGYVPFVDSPEPDTSMMERHFFSFSDILPDDLPESSQYALYILIMFLSIVPIFVLVFSKSKSLLLSFLIAWLVSVFVSFFFYDANYISSFFPITDFIVGIVLFGFKIFGSRN